MNKKHFSWIVGGTLLCLGGILQFITGALIHDFIAWPINLFLLILWVSIISFFTFNYSKNPLINWMGSYQAAIVNLLIIISLSVFIGLGYREILSSWFWLLQIMWLVTILWIVVIRRLFLFKWKDLPFYCSHLGLLFFIVALGLGSFDRKEYIMNTYLTVKEYRAEDLNHHIKSLPISLKLNKFTLENYPPKIILYKEVSREKRIKKKISQLLLKDSIFSLQTKGWNVEVLHFFDKAKFKTSGDSVYFVPSNEPGATYAAYVRAEKQITQKTYEGWISCGNFMNPTKQLILNDSYVLSMPTPSPQHYQSEIMIYDRDRKATTASISVNKPFHFNGWDISQYSYNTEEGRWSRSSIFQLVYDPWTRLMYLGLTLLAFGCLFQLFFFKK